MMMEKQYVSGDGKQYGDISKNLKMELPYDPEIPLLGINPKRPKTLT